MTTIASRKAKGRRLQQWVRDELYECTHKVLSKDDIRSTSMGAQGLDILLSPKAQIIIPFDIECKNKESLKGLYKDYQQAVENSKNPLERVPLLVIKSNGEAPLAVLLFSDLAQLLEKCIDNSSSDS